MGNVECCESREKDPKKQQSKTPTGGLTPGDDALTPLPSPREYVHKHKFVPIEDQEMVIELSIELMEDILESMFASEIPVELNQGLSRKCYCQSKSDLWVLPQRLAIKE